MRKRRARCTARTELLLAADCRDAALAVSWRLAVVGHEPFHAVIPMNVAKRRVFGRRHGIFMKIWHRIFGSRNVDGFDELSESTNGNISNRQTATFLLPTTNKRS